MSIQDIKYTEGTGNIYQDLGLPDAEERLAKARLAMRIEEIIEKRKLKQAEAAQILGVNQPKISAICRGQLAGFSLERLISYLNKLDQDVQIVVKSKPSRHRNHGHLRVAFA